MRTSTRAYGRVPTLSDLQVEVARLDFALRCVTTALQQAVESLHGVRDLNHRHWAETARVATEIVKERDCA